MRVGEHAKRKRTPSPHTYLLGIELPRDIFNQACRSHDCGVRPNKSWGSDTLARRACAEILGLFRYRMYS